MYTSFYQLDSKPFDHNLDQQFYWDGEGHEEILSTMQRGLLHNRKFLYLKGAEGAGKTTLVHALTRKLGNDFSWALVEEPSLDRVEFYNDIAKAFGLEHEFTSKVQFLIRFSHFLYRTSEEGKKILLLIDECHQLSQELLEELWLLSNIEKGGARLLNIYFVGQRLFDELLLKPKNNAVRQRITRNVELLPLDVEATGDYIRHQVKAAGGYDALFSPEANQAIHRYCRGNLNQINVLCDNALSTGSVKEKKTIDQAIIDECAAKLGFAGQAGASGSPTPSVVIEDKAVAKATAAARQVADSTVESRVQEDSGGGGWLKYAAGIAAIAVVAAGIYFWGPGKQAVDSTPVTAGDGLQEVSPSEDTAPQTGVESFGSEVAATESEPEQAKESITVVAENGGEEETTAPPPPDVKVSADDMTTQGSEDETGLVAAQPEESDEVVPVLSTDTGGEGTVVSSGGEKQQEEEVVEQQEEPEAEVADSGQGDDSGVVTSSSTSEEIAKLTAVVQETEQPVEEASQNTPEQVVELTKEEDIKKEVSAAETEIAAAPLAADAKTSEEPEQQPKEAVAAMEPSKVVLALQPNSLKLTRGGSREFDKFVEALRGYPGATMLVKGFVSSKTNSPENIKLSEERAMGVQKLLVAKGIEGGRIEVKGMGNLEPIASNDTSEGRRKNRRVEIVIVDDGT
ncbi:MAG: AAA family ATPase [Desulforhopalus sp.]